MSIKILPRKGLGIQLPMYENMIFCSDLSDISLGSFIAFHIRGVSPLSMHGLLSGIHKELCFTETVAYSKR